MTDWTLLRARSRKSRRRHKRVNRTRRGGKGQCRPILQIRPYHLQAQGESALVESDRDRCDGQRWKRGIACPEHLIIIVDELAVDLEGALFACRQFVKRKRGRQRDRGQKHIETLEEFGPGLLDARTLLLGEDVVAMPLRLRTTQLRRVAHIRLRKTFRDLHRRSEDGL